MNTIDKTIQKMDTIVQQCTEQNLRAGFFAVLYRHVTLRIKQGIDNKEFEDNERMEQFDILFAQRFFDAYDSYFNRQPATCSWEIAFEASNKKDYMVMQHLLLGINAHINLDLGIAAAETMQGKSMLPLKNDFDKINHILASLVGEVKENIGRVSPVFKLLMSLARGKDELLINFSIFAARDGAWKFALEYHQSHDKKTTLIERDDRIARLGSAIINPGKWLSFLTTLIKWGEYKPTGRKIAIIGQMV